MKQIKVWASTLVATLFSFLSCSKSPTTAATPTCLINTITLNSFGSAVYDLTYNSEGKISQVVDESFSDSSSYSYHDGYILLVTTGSNAVKDSVVLNGNDQIVYWREVDQQGNISISTYNYDSKGEIQTVTSQYNGGTEGTTTYQFSDGDCISIISGAYTTNYTYDTTRSAQQGDTFGVNAILESGFEIIKNAHLVTGENQTGGSPEVFVYTFDSSGKIVGSETTINGQVSGDSYTCQYNCN